MKIATTQLEREKLIDFLVRLNFSVKYKKDIRARRGDYLIVIEENVLYVYVIFPSSFLLHKSVNGIQQYRFTDFTMQLKLLKVISESEFLGSMIKAVADPLRSDMYNPQLSIELLYQ